MRTYSESLRTKIESTQQPIQQQELPSGSLPPSLGHPKSRRRPPPSIEKQSFFLSSAATLIALSRKRKSVKEKKRNECHRDGFFPLRRKFTRTRCVRLKGKKNCNIKGRKAYFCLLLLSLYPAQRFKRRIPEPLHSEGRRKKGGRIFAKTFLSFSPYSCAHFIRGPGGSLAPHPVSPVQKFFFNVDLFDRNVTWNTQCQEKLAKLTRIFSFC